jgi:hypothetical protein
MLDHSCLIFLYRQYFTATVAALAINPNCVDIATVEPASMRARVIDFDATISVAIGAFLHSIVRGHKIYPMSLREFCGCFWSRLF